MMYNIAHKFDIKPLMDMALDRLHLLLEVDANAWLRYFRKLSRGYI
jgi:hypothetical protein